jgi:hypothetical protein
VRTWLEQHRCAVLRKPFNLQDVSRWLAAVLEPGQARERGGAQA